jgi:streptolysin S family bacteriocin protoxin
MLARTMLTFATALLATSNAAIAQTGPRSHCDGAGRCRVAISVTGSCTDQANIKVDPEVVAMGDGGGRAVGSEP